MNCIMNQVDMSCIINQVDFQDKPLVWHTQLAECNEDFSEHLLLAYWLRVKGTVASKG